AEPQNPRELSLAITVECGGGLRHLSKIVVACPSHVNNNIAASQRQQRGKTNRQTVNQWSRQAHGRLYQRYRSKPEVTPRHDEVRFSNRPFRVKHFQTIRRCSVDVAHGLALLFGNGTKALPPWDSRTRWSNLYRGLAVNRTAGPKRTCELTSSVVPRGTSF